MRIGFGYWRWRLIEELRRYPVVDTGWTSAGTSGEGPVIPISFVKDGVRLSYFSLLATVGTPRTVAAQELRVECMFAADESTEAMHVEVFWRRLERVSSLGRRYGVRPSLWTG